jgi:hypothetical protein
MMRSVMELLLGKGGALIRVGARARFLAFPFPLPYLLGWPGELVMPCAP